MTKELEVCRQFPLPLPLQAEVRTPVINRQAETSLLRGTLTTFRRRCGKPSCHCAPGAPHESPALTYTKGERTKTLTLTDADVAAALTRFQDASAALENAVAVASGTGWSRGRAGVVPEHREVVMTLI
jgi:hypothetical protein